MVSQKFRFFERRTEPLLPFAAFVRCALTFLAIALAITLAWLFIGAIGLRFTSELSWEDVFYNAAMILATMGPVSNFQRTAAKAFVAVYALLSGLVFFGILGIAFAPVLHRLYHIFHLDLGSPQA